MTLATFKDVCLDAVDAERTAEFWAVALGGEIGERRPECVRLDSTPVLWVNRVPEPKTVKNRVHIDVNTESLQRLLAAGATVVDDTHKWTILADPDGGELCAFVRERVEQRFYEINVDCADPGAQALWWQEVLGGEVGQDPEHGWWWLEGVESMPFECIVFVSVPEPKRGKNRVHWDVTGDADALLAHGATRVAAQPDWVVLADPEGNEFCCFPR